MFRTLDQADVLRLIIGRTLPAAQQAWDARAPTVPLIRTSDPAIA
jgi:hypothetical protein